MNSPPIAFSSRVPPTFLQKVITISQSFGHNPSNLMACIAFETAHTFSPSIRNAAGSGAVGLIQFMPKTAIGLNTTVDELEAMDSLRQLDFVAQYFSPYSKLLRASPILSSLYMAILMPKYIMAPESIILFNKGTTSYRQNSGLDSNTDGKITKAEAAAKVQKTLEFGLQKQNCLS